MNSQENRDGISENKEKLHYQQSFLFLLTRVVNEAMNENCRKITFCVSSLLGWNTKVRHYMLHLRTN